MVTATPTPTQTTQLAIAPLRGTSVPAASVQHPSLAVKIDDHPAARAQIGLAATDLVYEELVEGGLTRYVAVWQSTVPDQVGPVRSIRPMDPDIVSPLGGIIAYSGGAPQFVAMIQATGLYNASDSATFMFRIGSKVAPHNLVLRAAQLVQSQAQLAPPQQQYQYAAAAGQATAASGTATAQLVCTFSNSTVQSWSWDASSAAWLRFQGGKADADDTGAQLRATNVVVLRVPVTMIGIVPKTELIGSGDATIASGGGTVSAHWSKASRTAPIQLTTAAGAPVQLAPGNTWFELVPNSGKFQAVAR